MARRAECELGESRHRGRGSCFFLKKQSRLWSGLKVFVFFEFIYVCWILLVFFFFLKKKNVLAAMVF